MTSETNTVKATCLCGEAKHEVALPSSAYPLKAYFCHCDSCRHSTGALCNTVAFLGNYYTPARALIDKLQSFQFSKRITQYFCPQCGTLMLSRCLKDAEGSSDVTEWGVATGTLEQADGVIEVQAHEHVADTLDGGFSDFLQKVSDEGIERWPHGFREGEQLPLYWHSSSKPHVEPSLTDKLHAHCKCGGINFWIARPSERSTLGKVSWPDVLIPAHSDAPKPSLETWWICDSGNKFFAGVCSCDSCRLACGMEWIEWAFVPTVDITLDEDGKVPFSRDFSTLKHYRSSGRATRHFCGTCGATVFWDGDERPQLIDVAAGLLDAPEGARAESWLEWGTGRLSFREDAMVRAESLALGVEDGLQAYGKKQQGASRS